MTIYVAEIDGRAVAAFSAETEMAAEAWAEGEVFKSDLAVLENEGRPLWDGVSEIFVREADASEIAHWEAAYAEARLECSADEEDYGDWLVFLVPVSDPTDEEE